MLTDALKAKLFTQTLTTNDDKYDVPALTTLMYKVCDNDHTKFEEACRLIELFMYTVEKSHE